MAHGGSLTLGAGEPGAVVDGAVVEGVGRRTAVIGGSGGFDLEVLEWRDTQEGAGLQAEGVGGRGDILVVVARVGGGAGPVVLDVRIDGDLVAYAGLGDRGGGEVAVGLGVLAVAAAGAGVDHEGRGEVEADGDPVVELALDVGAQVDALEVGSREQTVLVHVAQGEHVPGGVVGAGHADIVVLDAGGTVHLILPVQQAHLGVAGGIGMGALEIVADIAEPAVVVVDGVGAGTGRAGDLEVGHTGGVVVGDAAGRILGQVVGVHLADGPLHPLRGGEHVDLLLEGGDTVGGGEVHARFALLALAGGDDDDAVGTAGAVDGGGSGVLEDFDGGDIIRVEALHVALGHAVDHVERVVAGADGGGTADADLGIGARLGVGDLDIDTGELALEGLFGTGHRAVVDGGVVHLGDGRGQV